MKRILLLILTTSGIFFLSAQDQDVVDINKQIPVSINDIFFMADFTIMYEDEAGKKERFADLGLSKGQIFTYTRPEELQADYQSLVLINAYKYNEYNNTYEEYDETDIAEPGIPLKFKLLMACMSSVAGRPGKNLTAEDIGPSNLGRLREEVDNFKIKYQQKIADFLEMNLNLPRLDKGEFVEASLR